MFQQLYKRSTKEGIQNNGKLEALYRFDASLEEELVIPTALLNRVQLVPDLVPFGKDVTLQVMLHAELSKPEMILTRLNLWLFEFNVAIQFLLLDVGASRLA